MSKVLCVVALCIAAASCGGQNRPLPQDTPTPRAFPTPTPLTITAGSVLNMGMIGQTWTFQNSFGDINTFEIQAVPTQTACRGGNNLAIHMTKTIARTYWGLGADKAEVWSVLHQNDDGSWRIITNLINFPVGCPWCTGAQGTSTPLVFTGEIFDNQPGMPLPYLISPPSTSTSDHFINETRASATNDPGLIYNCTIPAGTLTGPTDGEYWRTDFYLAQVSTPVYSGTAIVSDQFESVCGHERWYFAPGLGIVEIDSPNDGGQNKPDPVCQNYTQHAYSGPEYNIKRIR